MKYILVTFILCSQYISAAAAFSIDCGSIFTADGTSFCIGIPVECAVTLDTESCIAGVDMFTESDLAVIITDSSYGNFYSTQNNSLITITIDYVPEYYPSTITVNVMGSLTSNCTFDVTHTGTVQRSASQCNYPLSLELTYSDSTCPGAVSGGDLISVELELISSTLELQDFELELNTSHPALLLTNYTLILNDSDVGFSAPDLRLLGGLTLPKNETLLGNVTFIVMPYVLPRAKLYFSFRAFYNIPSHGVATFSQMFAFEDCESRDITFGNISFHLPYYAEDDHVIDTFPPHADDMFYVKVPVRVPCVSTDLNVSVILPEFISDNFTRFFVNISDVNVTLPQNMLYINQLCQYQDIAQFDRSLCDFEDTEINANAPIITKQEMIGPGLDDIHISLGPLWYNLTSMDNCTWDSPSMSNCTCLEDEIIITLTGHVTSDTCEKLPGPVVCNTELVCECLSGSGSAVMENVTFCDLPCENDIFESVCQCPSRSLPNENFIEIIEYFNLTFCDLPCENQTLADNITCEYEYIAEDTIPTDPPSVMYSSTYDYDIFQVNASMPAISIPINSYTGDAGDSYNLTCGYLHNSEYSSFTTYDLNYTFSADFHLDPVPNITVCFFNGSSEDDLVMCEDLPFTNNTITRNGFHQIFKLHADRVELTVEVTIIQDVAPAMTFSNPGDAIFRSLPCNNTFGLLPITCSNSSSGSVTIYPVILKPWIILYSDVEATVTEFPANPSYVTIGERFNMTILAFMPECLTGLHLYVTLPNEGVNAPLVTLNDAYVTFIGSELLNTTLQEGDNITTGNNITVIDEIIVDFFFGPEVLVPATLDNTREVNNQSFEIGLDCTVRNLPSLVNGVHITFEAYVETDNYVRTQTERISPRIAEPYLDFTPVDPIGPFDAGDEAPFEVVTEHDSSTRRTSAFRFNFTFIYLTEILYLNDSDPSFVFSVNNIPVGNFTPNATFNNSMGMVPYRLTEKGVDDSVRTVLGLILTNNIQLRSEYTVCFTAVWHSLPPDYEGGRSYSGSGDITFSTDDLQFGITFTTSNPLTPGDNLQFQEQVSVNITVTFAEGISELLLLASHINYVLEVHSFNITEGKVLYIGENLRNLTFSVNDTLNTSPFITRNSIRDIMFDCGDDIRNWFDNIEDKKDEIVLNLLAFTSNDGSSFTSQQRIILRISDQIHVSRFRDEDFYLSHPEVQGNVIIDPTGSIDSGDTMTITVQVDHQELAGFVSYDILLDYLLVRPDNSVLDLTLLDSSSITGVSCFEGGPSNITKRGTSSTHIQYLLEDCGASIELETTVSDSDVFAGSYFTFDSFITEFYAVDEDDDFIMVPRWNYGPNSILQATITVESPSHSISYLNDSTFIAPLDELAIEHVITFPEGYTLDVSIDYRVVIEPPGDSELEDSFLINIPYSSVIFNVTDNTLLPSSLGDLRNEFDNEDTERDTAAFSFTIVAPENSAGNGFRVFAALTFNNTMEIVSVPDVRTEVVYVVLPIIATETNVSRNVVRVGDNVTFSLTVSRTDAMMPTYDVSITAILFLPVESILNASFDPAVIVSVNPQSNGSTVILSLTQLSYTPIELSSLLFDFQCRTGSLSVSLPYIQLYGLVQYQSIPSNGYQYVQSIVFPRVYVREAKLTFELMSTSLDLTTANSLIVNEEAAFRAEISNVTGPSADVVFSVKLEDVYVEATNVTNITVGRALNFANMNVLLQHGEVLVTFVNLSRVMFEPGEEDCPNCSIMADVHFRAVRDEPTVQRTSLNVSVIYDFITIEITDSLAVTPFVRLLITIAGPALALEDGAVFEVNATIAHVPTNNVTRDAYNLMLNLEYPEEYVLRPANFTYVFNNGTTGVLDFSVFEAGFNISRLGHNETLTIRFQFQLDPDKTAEDALVFGVAAEFSNLEGAELVEAIQASIADLEFSQGVFVTQHFISLTAHVEDSSSAFTVGNSFAINEVFQILLELPVPGGERSIRIVATIQTQEGVELPVQILDTEETIPLSISANFSDVFITQTPDMIEISWDLGRVVNPVNESIVVVRLLYTAVLLDRDISNAITLQFLATSFADDVMLSSTTLTADTLVPLLTVTETASVVSGSNPLMVQVTTILSHDVNSTGPAFLTTIQEIIPEILNVIFPYHLDIDGTQMLMNNFDILGNLTVLDAEIGVIPLQAEINLTYFALLSPDHQIDGTFLAPIVVDYTTIQQEGIGLLYDNLFTGRTIKSNAILCFNKMVNTNIIEVKNIEVIVITLFFGFLFILIILLIIVLIYYCIKRNRPKGPKVAPTALVAAVIGRNKKEEEEYLILKNKRPLFSSLIDALPKKTWNVRDDVYECREADYIAEVEGSLLYAKGQMIVHLFKYFLQSKTTLSEDKITKNIEAFEVKVNILQKTLQESARSELENAALKYGADKILKQEELDRKHQDDDNNMREAISMNLSTSQEVLQHLQEQNKQEEVDALDLIEITAKKEKMLTIKHYTSHYLLDLKAIVSNILREASVRNSDEIISELYDALEYGEKLIQGETNELIEMADIRGKRQKTVLLDKKLVEEADKRWRMLLLNQIDKSVTGLMRFEVLPAKDRDIVKKEMEEILLKEFDKDLANRLQDEVKLNNSAKAELKCIERQLLKPSPVQYYSDDIEMLETEFQKWHDKQIKREEALKQVEDKEYKELLKNWENWLKRRDKIVINFTTTLTTQLLTRGLELEQCDSIMQEHAKSRQELNEVIETSKLVQRAKFRARLNHLQERLFLLTQQNEQMFKMRMEIERKYLEKIKETFGTTDHDESSILEEYHNDIKKLEKSLSVEKLSIHINLKEKVSLRRRNKFEALYRQHLKKREEQIDEECLKSFLDRRRDIEFEIWTRSYEEECRRAEDEITQEKEKLLNVSTVEQAKTKAQFGVSNKVLGLSEPLEVQDETKMLLNSHHENLLKLSDKLENDRKKAVLDLERKMKQHRMQRERTLAQLIQPDWSQLKRSKFKELVQKQILLMRVEKVRKQNMQSLAEGVEELKKEFESKKQEAKEKLEKRLETQLIKVGKASPDKLVEIFEEMHYADDPTSARKKSLQPLNPLKRPSFEAAGVINRRRLVSDTIDPLLMNRPKQGELPPISTYLSRRGSL